MLLCCYETVTNVKVLMSKEQKLLGGRDDRAMDMCMYATFIFLL